MGQPGAAVEVTAVPTVLLARERGPRPFPGIEALIGTPRVIPPESDRDPPGLRGLEVSVSEKVMAGRVGGLKLSTVEVSRFVAERDKSLAKQPLPPGSDVPETTSSAASGLCENWNSSCRNPHGAPQAARTVSTPTAANASEMCDVIPGREC